MEFNIIIAIVSLFIAIYFLYKRYINFDNTPDKEFKQLVKKFNKRVNIDFDVQTNKLKLSVFKSILMDEHMLILALKNETSNKLLIPNTTLHNRGYDPIKKEFLLMSKEAVDTNSNINISIYVWLTSELGIRYEIYDES
jgi:hypothetical protein